MKSFRSIQWLRETVMGFVGQRTQDEWLGAAREVFQQLRDWSDTHGQKALTFGLLAGFFVAVFFKIFMAMLAISCILAFVIYELAPETDQKASSDEQAGNTKKGSDQGD